MTAASLRTSTICATDTGSASTAAPMLLPFF